MAIDESRVTPEFIGLVEMVQRAFEVEADDEFVARLRAYVEAPAAGLSPEAQKHAERGMHQLASAIGAYDKADDKPLWRDYLDASYAELFLGVTPKATEPVESCYLNDERVLYADQFFQVKAIMDEAGFSIPPGFHEPADHIAMEFALLLFLLREGDLARADAFVAEHLGTWVPRACADIIDRDDVGFYTAFANLARAILIELG